MAAQNVRLHEASVDAGRFETQMKPINRISRKLFFNSTQHLQSNVKSRDGEGKLDKTLAGIFPAVTQNNTCRNINVDV